MEEKNKKQKTPSQSHSTSHSVILKNILGIPPLVYIPILWGIIILGIILLIFSPSFFFFQGQYVSITSYPNNAAVFIDNRYEGSTPLKKIVSPGKHMLVVSFRGTSKSETIYTKRKIFLRKSSNATLNRHIVLNIKNSQNLIQKTIQNLAAWSINPYLRTGFSTPSPIIDILNSIRGGVIDTKIFKQQLFVQSLPYLNTLLKSPDTSPSSIMDSLFQLYTTNELITNYISFLDTFASQKLRALITYSQSNSANNILSLPSFVSTHLTSPYKNLFTLPKQKNIPLNNGIVLPFKRVDATTLSYNLRTINTNTGATRFFLETKTDNKTDTSPILTIRIEPFFILSHEVTQNAFAAFLKGNPNWEKTGKSYISKDHQNSYLKDFNPERTPSRPLRYVSYYDAVEFAKWVNSYAKPLGYKAKIPNEFEWRAAAIRYPNGVQLDEIISQDGETIFAPSSQNSQTSLMGSLWEWTESWYSPLPNFAKYTGPLYGSEKIILGGSFITKTKKRFISGFYEAPSNSLKISMSTTRNASHPPTWATPYVGFRIMLIPISQ